MKILTCFTVACFLSTFMTSCQISASPPITQRPDVLPNHSTSPVQNAAHAHSNNLQNALVGMLGSHFNEKLLDIKKQIRGESEGLKRLILGKLNKQRMSVFKEIKSFDKNLGGLNNKVADLRDRMDKKVLKEMKTFDKNLGDLKNELADLMDRMDKQTKTVQLQDKVLEAEDEKIDQLSECTSPKVAFTATLTEGGNLMREKDVTMKYENVLLNENGDYNQETGIFTAKEPGLYLFTLHVTGKYEKWADLYIAHNDQKVIAAFASGFEKNSNAASTDATLQLKVGDTVQVKTLVGKHDRKLTDLDGTLNSFSGVLIKSDKCKALKMAPAVAHKL